MKLKGLMMMLLVSFAWMTFSCGANSVGTMTISELVTVLDNPAYAIIDVRHDSFYNGFKEDGAKRGGHIKGAVQFTAAWLDFIEDDKFETFAAGKGITKEKTLVVYGSGKEAVNAVAIEFSARGYKTKTFTDFNAYADSDYPLESFSNYYLSVSPEWLNTLMRGGSPETYNGNPFMVFEVSWGPLESSKNYVQHIKGAYHFDTDWVEKPPVWNLREPEEMRANLLKAGIIKDKTVVLYSDNQLAAYRVFWALKWAGVEDVRVMNGKLSSWTDAGFPVETKINIPQPETGFGAVIPVHPEINVSTPEIARERQKTGLKLVSNRAWDEYLGKVSGYDYIPGKGEPEGAVWGFAGTDSSNMADYYDPDSTLRNPNEIFALWETQGIMPDDEVAFYCGTGWRAGVSWFMTQLAGRKGAYVYDGGWNAWQMDSQFPVQKGAPDGIQKPDSGNTFGTPGQKKAASCRS